MIPCDNSVASKRQLMERFLSCQRQTIPPSNHQCTTLFTRFRIYAFTRMRFVCCCETPLKTLEKSQFLFLKMEDNLFIALQHSATYCNNTLQHITTHTSTFQGSKILLLLLRLIINKHSQINLVFSQ